MSNIKKPVQTPGVARAEGSDAENEAMVLEGGLSTSDVVSPEQAPDLAAYIAEQVRKGIGAHMQALANSRMAGNPAADLPDQSEIDPHAIDREVLTKQGYVVPANPPPSLGGRPAHLRDVNLA